MKHKKSPSLRKSACRGVIHRATTGRTYRKGRTPSPPQRMVRWFVVCAYFLALAVGGILALGCKGSPSPTSPDAKTAISLMASPLVSDVSPQKPKEKAEEKNPKTAALRLQQIMADKSNTQLALIPSLVFFESPASFRQAGLELLSRQILWEKERRACNLLVALYKLATPPYAVGTLLRKYNKDRTEYRIAALRCPRGRYFKSIEISHIKLPQADLTGAQFAYARLSHTDFQNAHLQDASFQNAHLQDASFQNAHLQRAVFTLASMENARLSNAHLQGAVFVGTRLQGADLQGADLQDANLAYARLSRANLQHAHLKMANLKDADLSMSRLQGAYLSAASRRYLLSTKTSFLASAVCLPERTAYSCYLWHRFPDQRPTLGDLTGCPKRIKGPIFAYLDSVVSRLPPAKRDGLLRGQCPRDE